MPKEAITQVKEKHHVVQETPTDLSQEGVASSMMMCVSRSHSACVGLSNRCRPAIKSLRLRRAFRRLAFVHLCVGQATA